MKKIASRLPAALAGSVRPITSSSLLHRLAAGRRSGRRSKPTQARACQPMGLFSSASLATSSEGGLGLVDDLGAGEGDVVVLLVDVGFGLVDEVDADVELRLEWACWRARLASFSWGVFGSAYLATSLGELVGGGLKLGVGLDEGLSGVEGALLAGGRVLFHQRPAELRLGLQGGDAGEIDLGVGHEDVGGVLVDELLELSAGLVVQVEAALAVGLAGGQVEVDLGQFEGDDGGDFRGRVGSCGACRGIRGRGRGSGRAARARIRGAAPRRPAGVRLRRGGRRGRGRRADVSWVRLPIKRSSNGREERRRERISRACEPGRTRQNVNPIQYGRVGKGRQPVTASPALPKNNIPR